MKTIYKISLLSLLPFLFFGCGDESFNTVKYYKAHPKERNARIIECKDALKMTAAQKKDCQNAAEALREPAKGGEMDRAHNKRY